MIGSRSRITLLIFAIIMMFQFHACSQEEGRISTPSEPSPAPIPTLGLGSTRIRSEDGMVMVYVPTGEFLMGSQSSGWDSAVAESPQHEVYLDAYWIDKTEVTNAQYAYCVEAGGCESPQRTDSYTRLNYYGNGMYGSYPVIFVTWDQATAYCEWAGARLPTEEEWEYAARGQDGRLRPWGDEFDATRINYCDMNCKLSHADIGFNDGYADTAPVGSYPTGASWCGALDLLGNAWEWVEDWFVYYPSDSQDHPSVLSDPIFRVIRGGSWDTSRDHARCAFRNWFKPEDSFDSIGFRCASSIPPPESTVFNHVMGIASANSQVGVPQSCLE